MTVAFRQRQALANLPKIQRAKGSTDKDKDGKDKDGKDKDSKDEDCP